MRESVEVLQKLDEGCFGGYIIVEPPTMNHHLDFLPPKKVFYRLVFAYLEGTAAPGQQQKFCFRLSSSRCTWNKGLSAERSVAGNRTPRLPLSPNGVTTLARSKLTGGAGEDMRRRN